MEKMILSFFKRSWPFWLILFSVLLFGHHSRAKQIHIAILDTGISPISNNLKICPNGLIDLTGKGMIDKIGHGRVINEIIADRLKKVNYCSYVIKIYGNTKEDSAFLNYEIALLMLTHMDIDIVNYSSSGFETSYAEQGLIYTLVQEQGIKFVTAAGNNTTELSFEKCKVYPACFTKTIPVGNGFNEQLREKSSNYGNRIQIWRYGNNITADGLTLSGSSLSAAIYSADLALELSKKQK